MRKEVSMYREGQAQKREKQTDTDCHRVQQTQPVGKSNRMPTKSLNSKYLIVAHKEGFSQMLFLEFKVLRRQILEKKR